MGGPTQSPSWQRLLLDLNATLTSLMTSRDIETPPLPENWKPSLFRGDKPWGTTEDAVKIVRSGKVEEGRELLRRLCKHTTDPTPKVVFAWELVRPPENRELSWSYLTQLPDSSSEFWSIKAFVLLSALDYGLGGEAFLSADKIYPTSTYGSAIYLVSFLFFSDLLLQTRLLTPRDQTIESACVTSPMKGAAQLQLRQHKAAWDTFYWGWIQAEEKAQMYAKHLGIEMTAAEEEVINNDMSQMCVIGMGLTLWDLGLGREAANIFALICEMSEGNCRYAAQTLAEAG